LHQSTTHLPSKEELKKQLEEAAAGIQHHEDSKQAV